MHNVVTTGKSFVNYVTRLIWYLDPQWKTLVDQGFRVPHLVDQIYQTRTGRSLGDRIPYNDYMRKKQVKPRMEADKLLQIASEGFDYLNTVWMMESSWSNVRSDTEHMVIFINEYAKSLKKIEEEKYHDETTPYVEFVY